MKYLWVGLAVLGLGCLPEDTRPPPGRVQVNVEADDALNNGASTVDGWNIEFDRFLICLGEVELEGDDCSVYNETDYLRLLDLQQGPTQKLSVPYALGQCDFAFQTRVPDENTVLGKGVSLADALTLREPGSDPFAEAQGAGVLVSGRAVREGVEKRFSWLFRREFRQQDCRVSGQLGLNLQSDSDQPVSIVIETRRLFRDSLDDATAQLRFAPFVEADDVYGNGDGEITLHELAAAPRPLSGGSHGEWLYRELLPTLARFQGTGECVVSEVAESDGP